MKEINEAELQSESLERLLHLLDLLNNMLKDEELLKAISKLVVTEETFMLIDRLPEIIKTLEKITRPEVWNKINLIVDKLSETIEESKKVEIKPMSLSQIIVKLSDPEVSKGIGLALSILKAFGS
ncbi:MAG: DUF1641 domain-containing protein [Caldisphaera sp.]|jgi:uncharacterized protein YjgD (DUF1641 family)|nr:DUF1641 domain-containing protein [Caldisphaera sp.]PMP60924.1 MAG: hypothetical protein C0201_00990 [Caldisphaera sp.]PMP91998.1 MAG: hypothetical protein C0171_01700 [Caldisphaera sp.]